MSRIEYRAVHAHAPWRKVRNHSSLTKARYGPNGARSLLTGGLRKRIADYGPVSCVVVWEHGTAVGFIMRVSPRTGEVEERAIPMDVVLRYESRGGISSADIAKWFEGGDAPEAPSASQAPRVDNEAGAIAVDDKPKHGQIGTGSSGRSQRLSVARLEEIGRVRLSSNFFLRDFLHSEIAQAYGLQNVPDDLDLAVAAGSKLCKELLEPLQARFGRIGIRSAYRSCEVNKIGNQNGHNCATNERNYAGHIWDRRDELGRMGATACTVVPALIDYAAKGGSWTEMAWWIHDHLPYCNLQFSPRLRTFNIRWREDPERVIGSYVEPKGTLTRPGMRNHEGDHSAAYRGLLEVVGVR